MAVVDFKRQTWISNATLTCGFSALAIAGTVPVQAQETKTVMTSAIEPPRDALPKAPEKEQKRKKAPKLLTRPLLYPPPSFPPRPSTSIFAPKKDLLKVIPNEAGDVLYLAGRISSGSFQTFKQALTANPNAKTVILNSPGGIILDGALIGYWIKQKGLNTHVDHMCASSCTQIFAGGNVRTLAPAAQLGFHEPYLRPNSFLALLTPENNSGKELSTAMLRQSYFRAGVKRPFVEKVLKVHWTTMWFPNAAELTAAGFPSLNPPPLARVVPKTVSDAQAKIEAALATDPFWPALKQADIGLYTQSVSHALMEAMVRESAKPLNFNAIAGNYLAERLFSKFDGLPDDVLLAFGPAFKKRLEGSAATYGCSGFMFSEDATVDAPSNRLSPEESTQFLRMASAKPMPFAASQDEVSDTLAEFMVESIAGNTLNASQIELRAQSFCGARKVFSQITKLPAPQQVKTLRAIVKFQQFQSAFGR